MHPDYIKNNLCIFAMSKRTKIINLKKTEMKKQKDELEEINFQIFRIKYAIKQYRERCEAIGIDPDSRTDELLEQLTELIKKRDRLQKD